MTLPKRNKSLSRKVKGSGNWHRAVKQIARLYRQIANQRKDWHWKLATDFCRRFDTIVTETLNLDGMKRLWGRKVSDLAFYQFVEILKFKCVKHGREFLISQVTRRCRACLIFKNADVASFTGVAREDTEQRLWRLVRCRKRAQGFFHFLHSCGAGFAIGASASHY